MKSFVESMRISIVSTVALLLCLVCASLISSSSSFTPSSCSAALIGVDLGSEFQKVSSVKPGTPFHIVVDEQSARKVPAVIAFADDDERFLGNAATQLTNRRPKHVYWFVQRLIGKLYDDPIVEQFRKDLWPYELVRIPVRNTIGFKHQASPASNTTVYSAEELLSMSLQHLVRISEADVAPGAAGRGTVKDAVLTVPPHYDQFQRQALLDAADLADLNILSLINENSAAAVQYGIERTYVEVNETHPSQTHNIMLYNMGSTSTKVSIASYDSITYKVGKLSKKTSGQVTMRGVGYDATLGGEAFQQRLVEYVLDQVNKQLVAKKSKIGDVNIRENARAVAKIRMACEKAKIVLSANQETPVHLAGLTHDMDFKVEITRDTFYELASDLLDRVAAPIDACLTQSKLSLSEIDAVIIIGGSVRIPAVQQRIREHVSLEQLGQSLNGDESMSLGAVVHAANLSTLFQLRPFGLVDKSEFAVGVRISDLGTTSTAATDNEASSSAVSSESDDNEEDASLDSSSSSSTFSKRASLFKVANQLNKRKTVTWSHDRDFDVTLFQEASGTQSARNLIAYNVTGLSDALASERYKKIMAANDGVKPKVSLSFLLDGSSMASLVKAEATLDDTMKVPIIPKKPKVNSTSTSTTNSTTTNSTESTDEIANDSTADESSATESTSADDASKSADELKYKTKKVVRTIPLTIERITSSAYISPMTVQDKIEARARLAALHAADELKRQIAVAKNTLEAYIYATRAKLDELSLEQVSTEDQRSTVTSALSAAEDWLYETDESSTAKVFKDKLAELKGLYEPIASRLSELTERPAAVNSSSQMIEFVRKQVADVRANKTWIDAADVDKLDKLQSELSAWLTTAVQSQESLAAHDEPTLTSTHIYSKLEPIIKLSQSITQRKKPVVTKPKVKITEKKKGKDKKSNKSSSTNDKSSDKQSSTTDKTTDKDSNDNLDGETSKSTTDDETTTSSPSTDDSTDSSDSADSTTDDSSSSSEDTTDSETKDESNSSAEDEASIKEEL